MKTSPMQTSTFVIYFLVFRGKKNTSLHTIDQAVWYTIRNRYECEDGIGKSVPRVTGWHHEACGVMTNGDPEGRIFLSVPHTTEGFFFLLTIKYHIYMIKKAPRSS